jgi:hypothetical protein
MPVYMVERRFAEQLEPTLADAAQVNRLNADEDVRWLYSFLSADKRKTYCLYEADSPDAIIAAARRAGLPADVVVELGGRITAEGRLIPVDG